MSGPYMHVMDVDVVRAKLTFLLKRKFEVRLVVWITVEGRKRWLLRSLFFRGKTSYLKGGVFLCVVFYLLYVGKVS